MESAGLTDPEMDAALGHGVVSKVLEHYKNRSIEAIYRRLSKNSQKGIEVVSSCVEEFLI
jgi:flagellar motor switch protein FliG